jgi:hypothetical protein
MEESSALLNGPSLDFLFNNKQTNKNNVTTAQKSIKVNQLENVFKK